MANLLSLPFRKSSPIALDTSIRQYISDKYDQHPDMFLRDLGAIETLRHDAINVREPHSSGIKKLQTYAGQLAWIGGKFPIDLGAEFTWWPALGYHTDRPIVQDNLRFEALNVLFNLAALYSQLALNSPRESVDGLKVAAHDLNNAVGVLSHMQKELLPHLRMEDPIEDMDHDTLEALSYLCMAQSQECSWLRGIKKGFQDTSIAKLAACASDLYNLAAEAAIKSEFISSAWIHHMTAKHHHFAAAAQLRAAGNCLEKRRYGEEVARLRDSVACATEGLKETRGGQVTKGVADDLRSVKGKAEDVLKRAEKDNDMIFLDPVPSKSELSILNRFNVAEAKTPKQVSNPHDFLGDRAEFGPALFARLVPYSVHVATSIYEQRRDQLVYQSIMPKLEALSDRVQSLFSTLGIPGCLQALEKPIGLPPGLIQHCEELRQNDAIISIERSLSDIDKLRSTDLLIFEEGKAALHAEEEEDEALRRRFGTERWSRLQSRNDPQDVKFWDHAREIEGYFITSEGSDHVVKDKFTASKDLIAILTGSDEDLLGYIPSTTPVGANEALRAATSKLRDAYNDVLRAESRRRRKLENLKSYARRDDVKPDILKETARLEREFPTTAVVPAHFEAFFEKRLDGLYEPESAAVDEEEQQQESLHHQVEQAHRDFAVQRKRLEDQGLREREQALQRLDAAYYKYREIVNNVEVGRKFYNDLKRIVGQGFRDVVKAWVAQRRSEADALREELSMPALSSLRLDRNPSPTRHDEPLTTDSVACPQQQAERSTAEASIQMWAGRGSQQQQHQRQQSETLPRSAGTGFWTPEMGIKFGGASESSRSRPISEEKGQGSATWNPSAGIRFQ